MSLQDDWAAIRPEPEPEPPRPEPEPPAANPKMSPTEAYREHLATCNRDLANWALRQRAFHAGWTGALDAAIFLLEQEGSDIGPWDPVGSIIGYLQEMRDGES